MAVGAGVAGEHLDAGGRVARGVDVGRLHGAAGARGRGVREPGVQPQAAVLDGSREGRRFLPPL